MATGAVLSTLDAVTDIYVIVTYYEKGLRGQANGMLAMILTNLFIQILVVLGQYKRKSWWIKLKEVLITLLFLRPAVDANRVGTNQEDKEAAWDTLTEMVVNKVSSSVCLFIRLFISVHPSSGIFR